MESNRCNFEQSKALKALGYSWKTLHEFWWIGNQKPKTSVVKPINAQSISRPTIQDAIRWFRVEKGIHGWVSKDEKGYRDMFHGVNDGWSWGGQYWKDCDDAENALLNRLIDISNQEKARHQWKY